jgi:hypothetical protein
MSKLFAVLVSFVLMIIYSWLPLSGQTIYVSPQGNDKNPGTKEKPIASFASAQELARKFPRNKTTSVIFSNGTYYLPQSILFTADDSKSNQATVTYLAEEEGKVILSGGSVLKLEWKPEKNGIFVATVPDSLAIDQLYINGKRQRMARYPNAVAGKNVFDTWELNHNASPDSANDPLTDPRK